MKKQIILSLFAILILAGCRKYLTLDPYQQVSDDEAITDAGSARAAITGAYDKVQNYYQLNYPVLGYLTGDNVIFNGTLNQYLQLNQRALSSDNVIITEAWTQIYAAINSANSVIAAVPALDDPSLPETEKKQITGEAYFIRALAYFDLARGWGGVQLQLKPTTVPAALKGVKRSTLSATYDQVLTDLVQAESLLPDGITRNRAVKNTAIALRARLHLYREEWGEAETDASKIITNSNYTLIAPYKSFFTPPFLTKESIFEISYSVADANNQWNNWYPSQLGGQFTLQPSPAFITKINAGGNRNSLVATVSIGNVNYVYGNLYFRSAAKDDPAYVIRIAELYLIRAEARAQLENISGAQDDLNAVRSRAGLQATAADTKESLLLAIEDENSLEFAFEAHRWFDLVRTKRAGTVLGLTDERKWLFPIPFNDKAADPDLEQNPSY
jgi:hypothetical protein